MKEKLKLWQVAAYLPYDLQFMHNGEIWLMTSIQRIQRYPVWAECRWDEKKLEYFPETNNKRDGYLGKGFYLGSIKPILKPLNDLSVREFDKLSDLFSNTPSWSTYGRSWCSNGIDLSGTVIEWCVLNKLIEWRYDVFGLISKGLAIDVKNLNK